MMQIKSFLVTLGLGMVGGAAALAVVSRQPKARKAVCKAAETVSQTVEDICG